MGSKKRKEVVRIADSSKRKQAGELISGRESERERQEEEKEKRIKGK